MTNALQSVRNYFSSPRWDSWQTLIWISVFSWAVSPLARNSVVQTIIASGGWLFLIPGIHWLLHEEKFKFATGPEINIKKGLTFNDFFIGPWITGALVSAFLRTLINGPIAAFIVCWPPISAIIAVLPKFIGVGPVYKNPDPPARQELAILFLSNLVLSCWLQLYFSTQGWINEYPSLLADDFSRSAFVYRVAPTQKPVSRGVVILEQAEIALQETLSELPWAQVERRLLDADELVASIRRTAMGRLSELQENSLWDLEGRMLPGNYRIQLSANWRGPTLDNAGYYLTRACEISRIRPTRSQTTPRSNQPEEAPSPNADNRSESKQPEVRIECDPIQGPIAGRPPRS